LSERPGHICLVYDCLFPSTIGGAERWYRALAERLAAAGYNVTYLTLRQWPTGEPPSIPGVRVVAVGPRLSLYDAARGRRRIWPPVRFGLGVGWHLLRAGRNYDVVHTAAFPFFALLAAAAVRHWGRYRLVVDWWEVWTREYWREYLGPRLGEIGWLVQRVCARLPQRACVFSQLQAGRLAAEGQRGAPLLLRGVYEGSLEPRTPLPAEPFVVAIGRLIPDKRLAALPAAMVLARQERPELRATIVGDGPERAAITAIVRREGLASVVDLPGFVDGAVLDDLLGRALCLVLPSRREGFGLVVVEAAARGVPSVVVAGPDNAATELIEEGSNGFVAPSVTATDLASAILVVHEAGPALRLSTARWFAANAARLTLAGSLAAVMRLYEEPMAGQDSAAPETCS